MLYCKKRIVQDRHPAGPSFRPRGTGVLGVGRRIALHGTVLRLINYFCLNIYCFVSLSALQGAAVGSARLASIFATADSHSRNKPPALELGPLSKSLGY